MTIINKKIIKLILLIKNDLIKKKTDLKKLHNLTLSKIQIFLLKEKIMKILNFTKIEPEN